MNWIARNKFLFAGILLLAGAGIWYGLTMGSSAPVAPLTPSMTTAIGSPTQENADQQMVATLLSLQSVTLSGNIFQDPAFQSLRDFSTMIVDEPHGRPDPFAPLGLEVSAPISATTTSRGSAGTH